MAGSRQLVETENYPDRSDLGDPGAAVWSPADPLQPVRESASGPKLAQLALTIETEIIPRLMLAHRTARPAVSALAPTEARPDAEQVAEFARLILTQDVMVSCQYVSAVRAQGASLETVFLHLLTPAARLLGDLWREDLCSFSEVTLGLSQLQQVLRVFSSAFENEVARAEHGRRVLLIPAPGEQHTFGIFMVEEFFRRAGWSVWGGHPSSGDDLVAMVRSDWFDVVGFSVSCDRSIDPLRASIREIRRVSRNRAVAVLVGGPIFLAQPDLVASVGADATAADGRQATVQAQSLITLPPQGR